VWAWLGFVALALYAPLTAILMPDDSWLLSVTVAAMIGVVLIADDNERRKAARRRGGTAPDEG
jgi:hypothetical protein